MSNTKYKKIELHSTYDLVNEQEIIERERLAAQKLMEDNQIQFAIEIEEKEEKSTTGKILGILYVLNLIVKEDDVDKVIELLDKEGDFGYYVDLDSTIVPSEVLDAEEIIEDDPIKMSDEKENLDDYGAKTTNQKYFVNLIMKLSLFIAFFAVLIPEIGGIVYGIKESDYEVITAMFIIIVIEAPIFVWIYKTLMKL